MLEVTKPGQRGRNSRIRLKVSVVDGLNQLLSNFDNFLFASYNTGSQKQVNTIKHLLADSILWANVGLSEDKETPYSLKPILV